MSRGEDLLAWQMDAVKIGYVREFRFSCPRQWRFDFAILDGAGDVGVEVEGGSWVSGRHNRGLGFSQDCEKYAEAAIRKWRVIRVTTEQVEAGTALKWIERAIGKEGKP